MPMAWEQRQNGSRYYYRSVREGNRVRRVYIGRGPCAEAIAKKFETARAEREADRAAVAANKARFEAAWESLKELEAFVDAAVRTAFEEAGYHYSSGRWRRPHAKDG